MCPGLRENNSCMTALLHDGTVASQVVATNKLKSPPSKDVEFMADRTPVKVRESQSIDRSINRAQLQLIVVYLWQINSSSIREIFKPAVIWFCIRLPSIHYHPRDDSSFDSILFYFKHPSRTQTTKTQTTNTRNGTPTR